MLATLSLSFLSLALLLLAVQMALSLYNMLAVPTENWLRDYGIVVVSIMEGCITVLNKKLWFTGSFLESIIYQESSSMVNKNYFCLNS